MTTLRRRGSATEAVTETVKQALLSAEHSIEYALTTVWEELQPWQQDNHFILTGYRHASNSLIHSIGSLLYFHNETVNIYTHLGGAMLSLYLAIYMYLVLPPRYPTAYSSDLLAFAQFFAGAATCLSLSATFHTVSNHSPRVQKLGNALDYLGIVAMIAGSYLSCLWYGFFCLPHLRRIYTYQILLLGAVCAVMTLLPKFRTPMWRPFRAGMYVLYGLSGVGSIIHASKVMGWEEVSRAVSLPWMVAEGFLYILGASIYAARVPERWAPGKFDLVGASHQIFHVLVLAAAGAHLVGLVKAFDYRHAELGLQCHTHDGL